jgi:hypothetical protein
MSRFVTIATFELSAEAEAMKCLLEQEGFEVLLADENLVRMNWFLSGAIGGVKLQVSEAKAELASQFVEKHRHRPRRDEERSNLPDVVFECEECGKTVSFPGRRRGGVETCPYCYNYVDVPE